MAKKTVAPVKEPKKKTPTLAEVVQEYFPGYVDWTGPELAAYFGQDLINLLAEIANPKSQWDTTTTAGIAAIQQAFRGTTYWNTHTTAVKTWDKLVKVDKDEKVAITARIIGSKYGDLQLDPETINDLALRINRGGLDNTAQEQLIYQAAYKRNEVPSTGTTNPKVDLMQTTEALALKQTAKKYNFNPGDLEGQIQSILTGQAYGPENKKMTSDLFLKNARINAIGLYPHLVPQFDAGLSPDDILSSYKGLIARTLEIPENSITLDDPKYAKFLGNSKTGQMSLSDALTEVKTNEEYKFGFTNQANQNVSKGIMTLERMFGKRM